MMGLIRKELRLTLRSGPDAGVDAVVAVARRHGERVHFQTESVEKVPVQRRRRTPLTVDGRTKQVVGRDHQ